MSREDFKHIVRSNANREDFRYIVRHRFLPHSLLNHTNSPTEWFGSRYENEDKAMEEAKKTANFSVRDGIQVQVIKEEIVWEFTNEDFVGTWFTSGTPAKIEIQEEQKVQEPQQPMSQEELIWKLFTEKLKTRKEIAVIVELSYDTVCKIIRKERRRRGSVAVNAVSR